MSETTTEYGTPKTVCDTEPFPPQTGDLLGGYIARLSARVRELEAASTEPSAYQRSLEARIEELETADRLTHARMNSLCQEQNDLEQRLRDGEFDYCSERLTALEAKNTSTKEYVRNANMQEFGERIAALESKFDGMDANENTIFERLNDVQEHVDYWFNNDVGNRVVAFEARIEWLESLIERLMARMDVLDNIEEDYITFGCDRNSCQLQEPTEEPAVTVEVVTRERTHGRYGTRNLTKSKNVCATCGHPQHKHTLHKRADGTRMHWSCEGGTLGKPCLCREYKPVAGYW